MPVAPGFFRPLKSDYFFRRFLRNFPQSPLCKISENTRLACLSANCHNLASWVLSDSLSAEKPSAVFALSAHTNKEIMPVALGFFGPLKSNNFFRRFLRNFLWSFFCKISENSRIGCPCEICHYLEPTILVKSSWDTFASYAQRTRLSPYVLLS